VGLLKRILLLLVVAGISMNAWAGSFSLTDTNGKVHTLAAYKGKWVLVNFWATWCPPCRREMPELDRLYAEMQGQDVEIIAVSDEDPATIKKFLDKHPYHFNTGYFTHSNELISSINTRPVSILIKRGLVKDIVIGSRGYGFFRDWVVNE
jgi:thiol-disulfide isomerase/thioredoxin